MLKQYARNEKNGKRGVMVAFAEDKQVKIGYSFVHPIDKDKTDIERMEKIAIGRANTQDRIRHIHNNKEDLTVFIGRCKRYFKDAEMPKWTEQFIAGDSI